MPVSKRYRMKMLKPKKGIKTKRRSNAQRVKLIPTINQILRVARKTRGYKETMRRSTRNEDECTYTRIAEFTVCSKSGTARFLDLWNCDHFDGFSDMQKSINDCSAWFSGTGFRSWGSPETRKGVINCNFRAPERGIYFFNVRLKSYPTRNRAKIRFTLDNEDSPVIVFQGLSDVPHEDYLTRGYHHFRIKQLNGAFYFLSLTIFRKECPPIP